MAQSTLPIGETKRRWKLDQRAIGYLLVAPPLILMAALVLYPAMVSVVQTFTFNDGSGPAFSLANYKDFFDNRISVANLLYTIQTTLIIVAVLFIFCFPLALYLRFTHSRLATLVQMLSLFPLFVPGIILAYALIRFLGQRGLLDNLLVLIGIHGYKTPYLKTSGIVIGLVWESIPLTILILTAGLSQIDDALLESARDVGANSRQIFTRIILPLIQRPMMIVLSLSFLSVFGAFTIPYLLGPASPEMMGVYMRRTFSDVQDPDRAAVQAVVTFAVCAVVGLLYVRSIVRQETEEKVD